MKKSTSRWIIIVLFLLVLIWFVYTFQSIIMYVLIAWIISMLGLPVKNFLIRNIRIKKWHLGNTLAAVITLLGFFLIFTVLIWLFIPLIAQQATNLSEVDYGAIANALEEPYQQLQHRLKSYGLVTDNTSLETGLNQLFANRFDPSQLGNLFAEIVSTAGGLLIDLFSIAFISFFFLKEQGLFGKAMMSLVPTAYEIKVEHALEDTTYLLTRYFGGIVTQVTIITLLVSISLGFMNIKNALLIGFFAALINVIPYVGPIIGASFGILITISSNLELNFYQEMLPMLGKVAIVFACMQLLDNFILQPYIFSKRVLAHPLEIFLVVLMGAQVNGIVGMVLAIPTYTVIRVIAKVFLSEFKIVQRFTNSLKQTEQAK